MQLSINQNLGGNLVKRLLGVPGAFGIAYEVENTAYSSSVVLKIFNKEGDRDAENRFYQENEILHKLSPHKRIITPLSNTISDGMCTYYLMEKADCNLLKYFIDQNQKLNLQEIKTLAIGICEGIQHAHSKKVVHRDLHVGNILLKKITGLNEVKLTDFGLAKDFDILQFSEIPGRIWGALLIKPPEFYFNICEESSLDDYAFGDIYAIGILLFFLFNGLPTMHSFKLQYEVMSELKSKNVDPINSSLSEKNDAYNEWLRFSAKDFFSDLQISYTNIGTMNKANLLITKLCNPDFSKRPTDFSKIISEVKDL